MNEHSFRFPCPKQKCTGTVEVVITETDSQVFPCFQGHSVTSQDALSTMRRIEARDHACVEFVRRILEGKLVAYAKEILRRRLPELTQDAVHENSKDAVRMTLNDIYENGLGKKEEVRSVEAYVRRMTFHKTMDLVDARIRQRLCPSHAKDSENELGNGIQSNEASISQWTQSSKLSDWKLDLPTILNQIPISTYKRVFELRIIEEMSYKEIAKELEIEVDEVKKFLFRARNIVKKFLREEGGPQ